MRRSFFPASAARIKSRAIIALTFGCRIRLVSVMSRAVAASNEIGRGEIQPLYQPVQIGAWLERQRRRTRSESRPSANHTTGAKRVPRFPIELAWPEKVALVAAFIVAALCVSGWILTFLSVEFVAYGRLDNALAFWTVIAEVVTVVPIWLLLRGIDLVNGGPEARRMRALRRRIEPQFEADSTNLRTE